VEFNEVIKRRRMVHAFTAEPLAPGTADRLLRAANRAPSAGSSQGYSFLVLEGNEEAAPFWQLLYEQTASEATTKDDSPEQVDAVSTAPLVIVPLASKDVYLDRYARPEKGWTDRDEARAAAGSAVSSPGYGENWNIIMSISPPVIGLPAGRTISLPRSWPG
jgi:nitroreductase